MLQAKISKILKTKAYDLPKICLDSDGNMFQLIPISLHFLYFFIIKNFHFHNYKGKISKRKNVSYFTGCKLQRVKEKRKSKANLY